MPPPTSCPPRRSLVPMDRLALLAACALAFGCLACAPREEPDEPAETVEEAADDDTATDVAVMLTETMGASTSPSRHRHLRRLQTPKWTRVPVPVTTPRPTTSIRVHRRRHEPVLRVRHVVLVVRALPRLRLCGPRLREVPRRQRVRRMHGHLPADQWLRSRPTSARAWRTAPRASACRSARSRR